MSFAYSVVRLVPAFPGSLFLFTLSAPLYADVGEQFRQYVSRIIPLTHQVAEKTAEAKELAIFTSAFSALQGRLAEASRHSVQVATYIEQARSETEALCPKLDDGTLDIKEIFRQSAALIQSANHAAEITRLVSDYHTAVEGLSGRCKKPEAFEVYDDAQLGFEFLVPSKPGAIDGVYLIYAEGNGNQQSGGVEAIPLIGSVVRVINNLKQRELIANETQRLEANRAATRDLRRYAQTACEKVLKANESLLARYDGLAARLSQFAAGIPKQRILARAQRIQQCSERYEDDLAALLDHEAKAAARRRYGRQEDEAHFWDRYSDAQPTLTKFASAPIPTKTEDCPASAQTYRTLKRFSALSEVLGASQDPVVAGVRAAAAKVEEKCWGVL